MLEALPESQGKVMGVRARDKVTSRDYEEVLIPRLEALIQEPQEVGGFPAGYCPTCSPGRGTALSARGTAGPRPARCHPAWSRSPSPVPG